MNICLQLLDGLMKLIAMVLYNLIYICVMSRNLCYGINYKNNWKPTGGPWTQ